MNKVDQYIEKQNKMIMEDREKTLISLGLVEKVYSPDNRENWQYCKYDYINGEKRFYKEIAIQVTDEEYALILSKTKQVEEIKAKEERERQKERTKGAHKLIKKWIPVFEKPKEKNWLGEENEQAETGKSKAAKNLRITYYSLLAISFIISLIVYAVNGVSFIPYVSVAGAVEGVLVEALASILDYLAELVAIARNGYKYSETNK